MNNFSSNVKKFYIKQLPPFGTKLCSNICPQTLSVLRSEQFFQECSSRKTVSFAEQIIFNRLLLQELKLCYLILFIIIRQVTLKRA